MNVNVKRRSLDERIVFYLPALGPSWGVDRFHWGGAVGVVGIVISTLQATHAISTQHRILRFRLSWMPVSEVAADVENRLVNNKSGHQTRARRKQVWTRVSWTQKQGQEGEMKLEYIMSRKVIHGGGVPPGVNPFFKRRANNQIAAR